MNRFIKTPSLFVALTFIPAFSLANTWGISSSLHHHFYQVDCVMPETQGTSSLEYKGLALGLFTKLPTYNIEIGTEALQSSEDLTLTGRYLDRHFFFKSSDSYYGAKPSFTLYANKYFQSGYIGLLTQRTALDIMVDIGAKNINQAGLAGVIALTGINNNDAALGGDYSLQTSATTDNHWLLGIQGGINTHINNNLSIFGEGRMVFTTSDITEQKNTQLNLKNAFIAAYAAAQREPNLASAIGDTLAVSSVQTQIGIRFENATET